MPHAILPFMGKFVYVSEDEVKKNLPMDIMIDSLKEVFIEASLGKAGFLPRSRLTFHDGLINTLPAFIEGYNIAGLKTYLAGKSGHCGVVVVFNMKTFEPLACIESNVLGQRRTGALPAMLTREIHPDAEKFLLVGSGFQAETQLWGMHEAIEPSTINVYSRNIDNSTRFAERMFLTHGIRCTPIGDLSDASEYDVISTITNSNRPILERKDLGERYHINLAGSNMMRRREVAVDILLDADTIIVEDLEEAKIESAEIVDVIGKKPVLELKNLFLPDGMPERTGKTIFKTMGLGVEDLAAAHIVLKSMGVI